VAKTNTETIRELEKQVAMLLERTDNLQSDVDRLGEEVKEIERKQWNLTMAMIGAFFSLLVGLLVAFLRK
jgi:hypothetical protein